MRRAPNDIVQPGFRLTRFEVLNWGTFHARVWKIEPSGANALLTGDIGSGKSTLVDGLTTLLVPPRRITYNKAAGADARERSLYSYVRGEYRSVTNELTGGAQAQALRGDGSYSVILGVFTDAAAGRHVALAQVFWIKEGERNPERLYIVADGDYGIAGTFTDFGTDILNLRKRLRADAHAATFDSFEEYGARMRHALGIPHAQALDLFYQTVSMKSVGNLTEFVRRHMLEPDDTDARIKALISNFENLNHAHDAVVRARDQIERLTPLVADGERLQRLEQDVVEMRRARDALAPWFASHREHLIEGQLEQLEFDARKWEQQIEAQRAHLDQLSRQRAELQAAIDRQGGGRIREIEGTISHLTSGRDRQRADDETYRRLCTALGVRPGTTLESFMGSLRNAQSRCSELETEKRNLDKASIEKAVEFRNGSERDKVLSEEIRSLENRTSNIPADSIGMRAALAEALGVESEELPFVGELLQVRPEAGAWEGAIERLLHSFALNLLVPEASYERASRYIDGTYLRAKLVYLRVREGMRGLGRPPSAESVVRKLAIKSDSGFYAFLERELSEHFDYACCDLDSFHRLPRALTINGQIKANERRHEKDDRRRIDDRSRYVLGWDNREKLKVLRAEQSELRRRLLAINDERAAFDKQRRERDQRLRAGESLLELKEFSRIDWRATAAAIQRLEDEKRLLEASDDALRTLRHQLEQVQREYATADQQKDETSRRQGSTADRIKQATEERAAARIEAAGLLEPDRDALSPLLERWRQQVLADAALELRFLDTQQRRMREALQARIDADDKTASRLREGIVEQMQRYKAAYPAETVEMDSRSEALPEYGRRLQALQEDDLPRFEERFKDLLNKETINSMAAFQAHLQKRRHEIEERIRIINRSLASIEYDRNLATFIELVNLASTDLEVRDFQTTLRNCISGSDESGELYTEGKFLQVKTLVERLNGREGQADLDARWRAKVGDVRNWFEFGAKERWCADRTEREFYRDSSGKSGGQKEKLAYTILAAALAYQFGLGETAARKRHFRFVVIDEAFGRGSDDSTRYGLELFGKLDLQLLIVTPLQKIAVIEDYISAVHFAHNEAGQNSMVQNLTIEEYRARKQEFLAEAVSA
jgi:uncharacterized protein YPO0396